ERLMTLALSQPARALSDETHQSFPVPVRGPKGPRVAFFYSPALLSIHTGLQLRAPRYLARLDAVTGKFEELRSVSPRDFEQKHGRGELIGAYNMLPGGRTPDEFRLMHERLVTDYDTLMPLWAAGETPGSAEIKNTAAEFRILFPHIVEQPLLPYYYALGKD